ncbi:MAG TPA: hypothetical protein VN976_05565 [Verrucomicrobiae bacterium]|nr:hypothetical protein [Verrucomicrobiae bacterium]
MLADFVVHVEVLGVEIRKLVDVGVNITQSKFSHFEGPDGLQHIEGPAAFLGIELLEWAKSIIRMTDRMTRQGLPFVDYCNASIGRNSVEKDVAADPACASSCRTQGFTTFKS